MIPICGGNFFESVSHVKDKYWQIQDHTKTSENNI